MPQIWRFLLQNKTFSEQISNNFRFPKPNNEIDSVSKY